MQQIFAGDVNSPLKPPQQNVANKEQNVPTQGSGSRKTSVSHGAGNNFGLASPSLSRPGNRRRETSDSILAGNPLASPAGNGRFSRDEPSPFFRRAVEVSNAGADERPTDGTKNAPPFGGLMRSATGGGLAASNGPSSPWGGASPSAGLPTMGSFGSFAMPGSSGTPTTPGEKRPGFGSLRGESRFGHLMPKESSEDLSAKAAESGSGVPGRSWRSRPRTDTDPFGDESVHSGSAALGGGQDISPPLDQQRRAPGLDTPTRQISSDFGMSDMPGFREMMQHRRDQGHATPHGQQEPHSPAITNPYQSPPADRMEREDRDDASVDSDALHNNRLQGLGGIPEHGANNFGLPRNFQGGAFDGSDRSQTSSVNGTKAFPSLGGGLSGLSGLGALGGWPTNANPLGTPDRERAGFPGAFGNSLFGGMGDLQSPSLGGLGGIFGAGSSSNLAGSNTIGRNSKLGSLFPAAMQAQMHGAENEITADASEQRQNSAFGAIGRGAFGLPPRETDSPMRSNRGVFEDLFPSAEGSRTPSAFQAGDGLHGQNGPSPNPLAALSGQTFQQASNPQQNYQQSQASSDSATNQLPQTQQRTMVMPDRMRWVYLDPQGQTQGPWSGLEMHDWYKASFFTADLSVKKVEDAEFEPLGQLIRRIGNSREPFLVPQIGVPHGPATVQAGAAFAPAPAAPGNATTPSGSVQPPFAGAFPSFGTTLTAEQQNNLERRKQEEQYLMARQREFLAQQQVNMKQMQMQGGGPASLHHQSSVHSLQSQPSFGSMTTPIGMPPPNPMSQGAGFFDHSRQSGPGSSALPQDFFREEELARLSLQDRQPQFGAPGSQHDPRQSQHVAAVLAQKQEQEREATRYQQIRQNDAQGFSDRLQEFEQLRAEGDDDETSQESSTIPGAAIGPQSQRQQQRPGASQDFPAVAAEARDQRQQPEVLSLTQQVQKAASAQQAPDSQSAPESPWAKVGAGLPMPFPPPPQSTTPLPAPTAQRARSTLAEQLNIESRQGSETPELKSATPSLAPWAKETGESSRGPSLKEIQEAEAKQAAKVEAAAVAARRAMMEFELQSQVAAPAPAPGLPTTSTWGASASPAIPSSTPTAWAKPAVTKTQVPVAAAVAGKKTLAQIQKEEELRKQKLAAATAAIAVPAAGPSGGKRYADLASKPMAAQPAGSAWATVGAGGKVKVPTGPAAAVPSPALRPASTVSSILPRNGKAAVTVARPATSTSTPQNGVTAANNEFNKWAKVTLAKGLNSDINGKHDQFPPANVCRLT